MSQPRDFARKRLNGSLGIYIDGLNDLNADTAIRYLMSIGFSFDEALEFIMGLPVK